MEHGKCKVRTCNWTQRTPNDGRALKMRQRRHACGGGRLGGAFCVGFHDSESLAEPKRSGAVEPWMARMFLFGDVGPGRLAWVTWVVCPGDLGFGSLNDMWHYVNDYFNIHVGKCCDRPQLPPGSLQKLEAASINTACTVVP